VKLNARGRRASELSASAAKTRLESFVQPQASVCGKRNRLGIAKNFDGLLGGIDDEAAILALVEMHFNGGAKI
jgi:hypothetical protein